MIDDVPPPRSRHVLIGQDAAAARLARADGAGRLHHGWLLAGPEGIGKATLAYRFARFLLASPAERRPGGDGLATDPDGRTARQIAAGAHPNLVVLERSVGDGDKPASRTVSVEAVRKTLSFFNATAANGGRRICIIDPVDDLTIAAANALLKTLEEPPAGALLLLVSHAPGRLLPTVRSRTQRLPLALLPPGEVEAVLADLAGADAPPNFAELARRAAALSEGSVSRALTMLDTRRMALLDELTGLLDALPRRSDRQILALGDKLADKRRSDEFPFAVGALLRWLEERVRAGQHLGPARLAPLAELCEKLAETARTVETYNLDRRAFIVTTFGDVAEAVRRAA